MKPKRKNAKRFKDISWYNPRLYSKNKNQKSVIENLIDTIYSFLEIKNPNSNAGKKKMALNVILSNAVEKYFTGQFIAIPHYRNYYTNTSVIKLKFNTYTYIVGGVKALVKMEYLELKPGYYNFFNKEKNRVSSIRATKKLMNTISSYMDMDATAQNYFDVSEGVTYVFNEDEFAKIEFDCVVELKDKNKKPIEYRPNKISEQSKKFLRGYNSFIPSFDVRIPLDKIKSSKYPQLGYYPSNTSISNTQPEYSSNTTIPLIGSCNTNSIIYKKLDCRLKRVFNNGIFTNGGRFYDAEYQMLSEAERGCILINGNAVVEIDFKTFHPRMLYHNLGIDKKGDLYLMVHSSEEMRPAVKKMLNIMINTRCDYQAVEAFKDDLQKDEKGGEIQTEMINHRIDEWNLIELIRKAHKSIENYFGTNIGVEEQFKDSELAMKIMKYFMDKGIACLCVHDSFIVEERYKNELYELMMNEYKKMFGFYPELEINERQEEL